MVAHVQSTDHEAQYVHAQRLTHLHAALLKLVAQRAAKKILAAHAVHQHTARHAAMRRAQQRRRHLLSSFVG